MGSWDGQLNHVLDAIAVPGITRTAEGLSTLLGRPISMSVPRVVKVPVREVPERIGTPEELVVAVYLLTTGRLPGHVMLILPYVGALHLVDMLLEQPEGTTQQLTPLEESALGEVGNISASILLNFVAATMGMEARPSPPAVIVDMVAAILDIILSRVCQFDDELLLLETVFHGPDRQIQVHFWIVPDGGMEQSRLGGNEDGE